MKKFNNSKTIQTLNLPSMTNFYTNFYLKKQPLVIREMINKWPAFKKWNFSYLNEICGHRIVPIEIGKKYTDEDWCQKLMTFHDYLKLYVFNKKSIKLGYLAQHHLLDQIPELLNDIIIPDYCAFGENGFVEDKLTINVFIGPKGTISPLHTDPRHNFFCQILGEKFVRLINPLFSDKISLFQDLMRHNTSQIDVEKPDLNKHPTFKDVQCEDYIVKAGDCLFIPQGYFHYVKALQPSISVSIWFG